MVYPATENGEKFSGYPVSGGCHLDRRRGPTTVNVVFSKKNGYRADTYYGASFLERKDELTEAAIQLVSESGLWSPETARKMVMGGMEGATAQNMSMVFIRSAAAPLDKPIGFSWQEVHNIPTSEGNIPVVYLRLRAFKRGYRRLGLGGVAMQLGLHTHSESQPLYLAHRTASPAAAYSVMKSEVFRPGELSPWEVRYDDDTGDPKRLKQQILTGIHFRVRTNGKEVNMSTGVSIADYSEENAAYEPDFTHAPTMEIRKRMEEEFGMVFSRGDSLIALGPLK